jgi:hypothetical protein
MKRIVHGATYDTASSTRIAAAEWEHPAGEEHTDVLYQTRGGAFFVHRETTLWRREEGALTSKAAHRFDPMSREEAHAWMLQGDVEVFDDTVFKLPPEAAATDDATEAQAATVYVRVPPLLKETIEAAAKEAGQSLSEWLLRCLERCAAESDEAAAS